MSLLFLLFTVVPAVELYLLIKIGGHLGVLETIWLVLVTGFLGAWAAKNQGQQVLIDIQATSQRGELPTKKLIEGLLIFVGGILLITPGVITDVVGLCLIFPLTRIMIALLVQARVGQAVKDGKFKFQGVSGGAGASAGFTFYSSSSTNRPPNPFENQSSRERDVTPHNPEKLSE